MLQKQEVLIVLDDPSPSEDVSGDRRSQTTITPLINQSQCLLDLDIQPKSVAVEDSQSKAALEGLNQSILPESPAELKEKPEPPPLRSDPHTHTHQTNRQICIHKLSKLVVTISILCPVVPAVWPCSITRERRMMS